jgi:hypothetical protein
MNMSVKDQIEIFGAMSPTAGGAKHVADIVAALAPPTRDISVLGAAGQPAKSAGPGVVATVTDWLPGLVGGGVGYAMWKKHPVLGFLGGHALGQVAGDIYRGDVRGGLCNLGVEAAGIAGALKWKKHPVFGWLVGVVAGTAAAAMVPGSDQQTWWRKVKAR